MKIIHYFNLILITFLLFGCEKQNFLNLKKLGEVGDVYVSTNNLQSISLSSDFLHDGYDNIKRIGFVWSDVNNVPTISDNLVECVTSEDKITTSINWSVNTQIYVRSFIENSVGIFYSVPRKVNWIGGTSNLPTVQTINPNQFGFFELTINGNILSNGGIPISEQGFCYSKTSASPTIANNLIINSSGNSSYSEFLSGLDENCTYHLRAYAKNLQGVGYGSVITITTKNYYYESEVGPYGGIIFQSKIDTTGGWNFLEAAPNDVSVSLPWANDYNSVLTSYALGTGGNNTNNIIQLYGSSSPNYAALAASNYSSISGSNWYLPSRDELIKIREVLYVNQVGNLISNGIYWSSSQDPNFSTNAWAIKMTIGSSNPSTYSKTATYRIRPIRRF